MNSSDQLVLFARVGRMRYYAGSVPDDKRPVGGGGYNRANIGHELYNFRPSGGRLYGYFQPHMATNSVALERIGASARKQESLDDVLVVFFTRRETGGQVVVGWYRHARVNRHMVAQSPGKPRGYGHYISARASDCVLLPIEKRSCEIPNGPGGTGQANVCYPRDSRGNAKNAVWMKRVLAFVDDYQGPNLLTAPEADAEAGVADVVERALAQSKGQGFARTPEERRAIEERAMKLAKRYYEDLGYSANDVSKKRSYDYECTRGKETLHVEVKGTTTDGKFVILTNGEVTHACNGRNSCALFVVHSIKLRGRKAHGGKQLVFDSWRISQDHLTPIAFTYRLP